MVWHARSATDAGITAVSCRQRRDERLQDGTFRKKNDIANTPLCMLQVSRQTPGSSVMLLTDGGGPSSALQMPYNQTTCHVRSNLILHHLQI